MAQLTKYERPALQPISDLRREMDRLFNELIPFSWRLEETEPTLNRWLPTMDMVETDEDYTIKVDLPGMNKNDININVHDNVLSIEGERKKEAQKESEGYLRSERSFGTFKRSFTIPVAIEADKIKASFKEGVLAVHVPKAEKSKRKSVKID
ncbi:MAG: Hsp20/alpha crystallin family protein [Balneolaceae bacterium]|jgi:HSP20 family protein